MALRERFPRRTGVATLVARTDLSPVMTRVTLRCDAFGDDWPIEQPAEIITLLFAAPGEAIVLPSHGWVFPAGSARQEWRNYTVRRHRRDAREIDVDVVLHAPPGPACTWASRAAIGADVGYAGPRVDFTPRDDVDWLLLCGDETALPAIAAILEEPPGHGNVTAVVEVPDGAAELPLELPPGSTLYWVHRERAPAATTTHLVEALRELPLPPGKGQAWGAAESRVARDLRAVLRDHHGLARSDATARGYWLRWGEWLDEDI